MTLVKATAEINARDADGRRPLHWSAINDPPQVASVLITNGAEIVRADDDGKTARQYAEESGHDAIVRALGQKS